MGLPNFGGQKMQSDPLFIKTQTGLQLWRANKKSSRDHIPGAIKDNIKKLNMQYSKAQLRSKLDLSGCSLAFLKESKPQEKKSQEEIVNFIEVSPKQILVEKERPSSKIELILPMGVTLRIYQ
jgi:hypothetical protein